MKQRVQQIVASTALGAALGAVAAARWIAAGSGAGLDGHYAVPPAALTLAPFALALLIVGAVALALRAWKPAPSAVLALIIALPSTLLAILAIRFLADAAEAPQTAVYPALAVALILTLAAPRRYKRVFLAAALVIAAAATDWSAFPGDSLAAAAVSYSVPPLTFDCLNVLLQLALLGAACAAALASLRPDRSAFRLVLTGAALGCIVALVLSLAQITTYLASMGSGLDPLTTPAAMITVCAALSAPLEISRHAYHDKRSPWTLRAAPLFPLLLLAAYITVAAFGTAAYVALDGYHADITYAYLHFSADGSWARTLDQGGSANKLWRIDRFLSVYPFSAFRPAALLQKAEAEFDLWRFDDALDTLRILDREYPYSSGYRHILASVAGLAAGDPHPILREAGAHTDFETWRASQGALLAGTASERIGHPVRAAGYYSSYLDYLQAHRPTSWLREAVQIANQRLDKSIAAASPSLAPPPLATVTLRILVGDRPIPGARVSLVQPHLDAALLSDSRAFTGAWTVAAWSGACGTSDEHGRLVMTRVPYGTYDIILGLNLKTRSQNAVLRQPLHPVLINKTIQHLPKISLVPALTLRSPLPGGTLAPDGALSWQPYPGAAYYSITVLSLTEPPSAGRPRDTATCWSRTAVAANRTPIDRQHFINGHTRLQPGGTYMWVVYAHARDGRMLSSSEHYFELGEPTFTVARPRHQAGRPAAPSVDRSPSLARDAAGPHSLENATRFRSRRGLYAAIPKEEGL